MQKKSAKKTIRAGKGSHGLGIIKKLVEEKENWEKVTTKSDYQFPGVFTSATFQRAFYTPNCRELPQSSGNAHFLWDDTQLSKSRWNKDREVDLTISGRKEKLLYRVASCNGVKLCPIDSCDYVTPISVQRPCSIHGSHKLIKSNDKEPCPVQFAYLYPKDTSDHRRWIFAFVRHQKGPCESLYSHPVHGSSKVCSKVKEMITEATELNPGLKPSDVAKGRGVLAIPGAIDMASSHIGRIGRQVRKSKLQTVAGSSWGVENFEKVADEVDSRDEELTGDTADSKKIKSQARPYLVAAGIESGIKFVFCMNPHMCSLLAKSEFVEADITFNETREYPYLFNMVAFNYVTMDWVVVSRIRMNKQDAAAHGLAYSKTFTKCKAVHSDFEPGESLRGIIVDWSDAEIKGLGIAVGKERAITLLKGCKVHWTRSWQRVRDRIVTSNDKVCEKNLFSVIASNITKLLLEVML